MSEAMTVETIVEADWQMQGFWTKLRFPLQTSKGGWSDIDILAYNPGSRVLVIAESKVRGTKKAVYAYTKDIQKRDGSILEYDLHGGKPLYFRFLRHIKLACKDGKIFDDFDKMVRKLIVQLVSNYVISDDLKPREEAAVKSKVRKDVTANVDLEIKLETTLDVISRIIKSENKSRLGKRYGHPVIDIARELNRYMHPKIHDGGREKTAVDAIKKQFAGKLSVALGMQQ